MARPELDEAVVASVSNIMTQLAIDGREHLRQMHQDLSLMRKSQKDRVAIQEIGWFRAVASIRRPGLY